MTRGLNQLQHVLAQVIVAAIYWTKVVARKDKRDDWAERARRRFRNGPWMKAKPQRRMQKQTCCCCIASCIGQELRLAGAPEPHYMPQLALRRAPFRAPFASQFASPVRCLLPRSQIGIQAGLVDVPTHLVPVDGHDSTHCLCVRDRACVSGRECVCVCVRVCLTGVGASGPEGLGGWVGGLGAWVGGMG